MTALDEASQLLERTRRSATTALLLYLALSLVLTFPLVPHLATAVEDRQDALLNVWITAWDGHQLVSDPLHLFDANIFYPYPRTLAYSELLLGNGLLALPPTAATGNPVLGYNVVLLLSFVLTGWGCYLLVLRLTRSQGAALVAGAILAFCSYRMTNLAQAQLLTLQWMPLSILSLLHLLRRPRARHVATLVLFFCLQALSSFYYGMLLALALVILGVGFWLVEWRAKRNGLPVAAKSRWAAAGYLLLAGLLCAVLILPFALPYFRVQRELGFERGLADSEPFSASLRQYLLVPPGSVVHGRWLPSEDRPVAGGYPVDALFPGLTAVVLALWGLCRGRDRRRWLFLLLLLAAWLLSLGPRLYLAPGRPANLDLALPYAWLYTAVPGFKALRAPVRVDAVMMLALAVLAGYGVAARENRRRGGAHAVGHPQGMPLLLLGLVVVESLVWPAARAEKVPVGDGVPAVYRMLAAKPSQPILELPMAFAPGGPQLDYQYLSTYHWSPTPDGYSGFVPPKRGQIAFEMDRFPSERSVSLLQALGVQTVIVHGDRYPAERWQEVQQALEVTPELAPVWSSGTEQAYTVRQRTPDKSGLEVRAYLPPQAGAGLPYSAYLIAVNHGERSYAVEPTTLLRPVIHWEAAEGGTPAAAEAAIAAAKTAVADLPLVTSPEGGAAVIGVTLAPPGVPGRYRLSIGQDAGPLGGWRVEGQVEVLGQEAQPAGSFPVPATLASWNLPAAVRPGQLLPVDLTWRALGKIDAYYSVYVKLLDGSGTSVAGWDGQPQNGAAPTLLWVPGETVEDVVTLTVPPGTPPGDYVVEAGMYRAEDLARCLTLDAAGTPVAQVVLGTVRLEP